MPLPKIKEQVSVNVADGIDKKEAGIIATAYLERYVTLCGMPGEPVRRGHYWKAKLWTGYTGSHFSGTLWISEMTGEVVLDPPRKERQAMIHKLKVMEQ